jgi:hypothetical protein
MRTVKKEENENEERIFDAEDGEDECERGRKLKIVIPKYKLYR